MSQNINITYSKFFLKSRLKHLFRNRSVIINNSCQHISNLNILYLLLDTISHAMPWQSKTIHQKVFKTKINPTHLLKLHPFFLWTPTAQVNCHFSKITFLIPSYKYYDSKFSLFFFMVPSFSVHLFLLHTRSRVNDMGYSGVHLVLPILGQKKSLWIIFRVLTEKWKPDIANPCEYTW